ncbi:NUproduct domain-containing protein [Madurella fahalii]|uniref:NUproduct domain-containing protein n=1 Tax=Madurella fahalii TaxID=1157608 RepID=A0ABQ0GPT7_9PEZI
MADPPGAVADPVSGAMVNSEGSAQPGDLQCCCGKDECVYLRHNCSVLLSVERDVHTAAKMGQTLLARHEAYMASAERDRVELTARIEQLEHDNAELEAKNKLVTDENHDLREELEYLNDTIKDAETKMEYLEATLRDSQQKVRGLEIAADRAIALERQIAMLEEEQVVLQTTIVRSQEEARTAMHRWRQAEKGLSDLQEQLERMEKEAREERERHIEVIGRMERQRAMEKELSTAAGRLKGAAGVKSMTESKSSGSVVSHFVRDLLQDNANLQVGIAELREMLLSSNDEIQMLREQLMYHQPLPGDGPGSPKTLQAELENKEAPTPPQPPRVSQELHIHHHYHVTPKQETRKSKKRRQGLTAGTFTPPPYVSAPGSPLTSPTHLHRSVLDGSILSPRSDDSQAPHNTRWSLQSSNQSEFVPSTVPSSPRSDNRTTLFDRIMDVSSPGSPATSVDPTSPGWRNAHKKKASEFSLRSISETAMFPTGNPHYYSGPPPGYAPRPQPLNHFARSAQSITAPYTTDDVPRTASTSLANYADFDASVTEAGVENSLSPTLDESNPRRGQGSRGLRRVVSHESIMSLSNGLDIHTLKARPSQLTLRPLGLTTAGTDLSAVTAQPTLLSSSSEGKRGSVILRDNFALFGQSLPSPRMGESIRTVSSPTRSRDRDAHTRSSSRAPSKLGRLVSWRPWAAGSGGGSSSSNNNNNNNNHHHHNNNMGNGNGYASPSPSPEVSPSSTPVVAAVPVPTASAAIPALSLSSASASLHSRSPQGSVSSSGTTATTAVTAAAAVAVSFRAPGINQPGVIPGFQEYWAAHQRRGPPSKVSVEDQVRVREALKEVLEEG